MSALKDITGQRFSRIVVLSRAPNNAQNQSAWFCRCDCGTEKIISGRHLYRGTTKSCGCWNVEFAATINASHGQGGIKNKTTEYRIWSNMMSRCSSPTNPAYKDYGGRGITVCPRWQKFENFYDDMGKRPSQSMSLDRKNNDLGYSKSNCHWATRVQQARNARSNRIVEYRGRKMTLAEAAELSGTNYKRAWWRISVKGMSVEDALNG